MNGAKRACPECKAENWIGVKACVGCKFVFPRKPKKPKVPKAAPEEPTIPLAPEEDANTVPFAAGLTSDGRLFLSWPNRFEQIVLSVEQTAVARQVLVRFLDAPKAD